MVTVKCQECGTEFSAQRASAKFCSTKCRVKFNKKNPESEQKFESDNFLIKKPKEVVEITKAQIVVIPKGLSQPLVPNPVVVPKGVNFASGSDLLKSTPKSTFQLMLAEFNGLVMEQPPVSQVKNQLLDLLKRAEHPEFTFRQVEAIRERCINYLNGTYGVSAKKDSYNNNK